MMYLHSLRYILVIFSFSTYIICHGFLISHHPLTNDFCRTEFLLHAIFDESDAKESSLNKQRTCVKQFLTQRAIQSFMFLCTECRDPHTSDWIERFLDSTNLLEYHGTGAFNMTKWKTWDSIFLDMMEQPVQNIIIQARRRGGGHGGWSKTNPYLKDRFVEFEISVDPTSLASRILAVREQIAKELVKDLDLVIAVNEVLQSSIKVGDDKNATDDILSDAKDGFKKGFDRKAMQMFANRIALEEVGSSSFRKGNFDLILLISLQESVHRVLQSYSEAGEEKEVSFLWFREFYKEHVHMYFDGNGQYGRADNFIERLLLTVPSVNLSSGDMGLVDTVPIAEDLLQVRSNIAMQWKDGLTNVQSDHSDLRKCLFTKQMASWGQQPEPTEGKTGAFE